MNKFKQIVAAAVAACSLLGSAQAVTLSFEGSYDPANWTFSNVNADGDVDFLSAPVVVALLGGDNSPQEEGSSGITRWTLNGGLPVSGDLDFYWSYFSDDEPGFDAGGFHYNGADFDLATFDGMSGHFFLNGALAGEDFGFYVSTEDNFGGPGVLVISSQNLFATPDGGSTLFLLGGGVVVLLGMSRRMKLQA